MRIAIFGATSQIAKDLVRSFSEHSIHEIFLYARRPEAVTHWLAGIGLSNRYDVANFTNFSTDECFDAVINFVGIGNPIQTVEMGAAIFDVTSEFDNIALTYVRQHPNCRYLFLSSGAAYGSRFDEPAIENSKAEVAINNLQPQDWYTVAKLYAECRHRSLPHLPIIDIRVFNYFSSTQDISTRFLITDIVRAIQSNTILKTSPDYIVRDYLHPVDFHQLISTLLSMPAANTVVDCYSRAPIDKPNLLTAMQAQFGLQYEIAQASASVNATGNKPYYYSLNTHAAEYGYKPIYTSLEGLIKEMQIILNGTTVGSA
ncbi:MAG: NAD(P)-dependent oxidoreductase [Pseudomonadota bacterium]